jgi:hypothetical protein
MEQVRIGVVQSIEPARARATLAPLVITLEISDPEVAADLRRFEGDDRERRALAALRLGVLAMRSASGQIDVTSIREAGDALVSQMRELLSARASEMTERLASTLGQYLDPKSGVLPQRLESLVQKGGEIDRLMLAHVGADDSVVARSLAMHLGDGSPVFKMLSPDAASGLRAQLTKTIEESLADQRKHILREFSLDHEGSALKRLLAEFSLDRDESALARLKKEVLSTIDKLAHDNVEFQTQVRESLARIDTRKKEAARTPRHGITFEERLGALLADEAQRLGDLHQATGDTTGIIKNCKVGDYVVELGTESAAAHARIVWEAKEKQRVSVREALDEIASGRRNRQAQVGVFVFSAATAPEGLEPLQRHGGDVVVVWDADDPASDLVIRAAYSLARALAVRERRSDDEAKAAVLEIDRATRAVEKQAAYLDDVRKWAETVRSNGEKIVERSTKMADDLRREIEHLDAQVASLRTASAA